MSNKRGLYIPKLICQSNGNPYALIEGREHAL